MLFIFTFLIKRFKKEHIVAFFERNVSLKGKATETIGTIESYRIYRDYRNYRIYRNYRELKKL